MTNTPIDSGLRPLKGANKVSDGIDRESVEWLARNLHSDADDLNNLIGVGYHVRLSFAPDTLLALRAALDAAEAEKKRLREALQEISRQKKTDELETEYDVECADFEGGYDACVDRARAALDRLNERSEEENPDG